jgi:hypothetical protein
MIETELRQLDGHPSRYGLDETARRLTDLRSAYAINMLSGVGTMSPTVERLPNLLASGRIGDAHYLRLARALAEAEEA